MKHNNAIFTAVIAILLLVAMVGGMLPVFASADNDGDRNVDQEALDAVIAFLMNGENRKTAEEPVKGYVKPETMTPVLSLLERNAEVDIIDELDDYYVIADTLGNTYYTDKAFVRTEKDATLDVDVSMFTADKTKVYSTAYMEGEPVITMGLNGFFTMADKLGDVVYGYCATKDGEIVYGYTKAENLSKEEFSSFPETDGYIVKDMVPLFDNPEMNGNPIKHLGKRYRIHVYEQVGESLRVKVTEDSVSAFGMEGYIEIEAYGDEAPEIKWAPPAAGGGGGSSGGGGGGGGFSDGADIFLAYRSGLQKELFKNIQLISNETEPERKFAGERGVSFTDGLKVYAALYKKGDEVALVEKNNDYFWTVLVNNKVCVVPAGSVRLEGEPDEDAFEAHEMYGIADMAGIYDNPELSGNPIKLIGKRVKVWASKKVGNAYYIEVTETSTSAFGTKGYISIDNIGDERPEVKWAPPAAGGGGGDGGSGGGGGGGGEWSSDYL